MVILYSGNRLTCRQHPESDSVFSKLLVCVKAGRDTNLVQSDWGHTPPRFGESPAPGRKEVILPVLGFRDGGATPAFWASPHGNQPVGERIAGRLSFASQQAMKPTLQRIQPIAAWRRHNDLLTKRALRLREQGLDELSRIEG